MLDTIFTTGAFLKPYQMSDGRWGWIVVSFEGDTFLDEDVVIPVESAACCQALLIELGDDDET